MFALPAKVWWCDQTMLRQSMHCGPIPSYTRAALAFADVIALNKFDKRGSLDALRDVKKQYMRNNNLWDIPQNQLPVYGTIASQFNDPGMNLLYKSIMDKLVNKTASDLKSTYKISEELSEKIFVIPPSRVRYLSEISEKA